MEGKIHEKKMFFFLNWNVWNAVVPKSKKVLKRERSRNVKKTREQLEGAPTGQILGNSNIKINNKSNRL